MKQILFLLAAPMERSPLFLTHSAQDSTSTRYIPMCMTPRWLKVKMGDTTFSQLAWELDAYLHRT